MRAGGFRTGLAVVQTAGCSVVCDIFLKHKPEGRSSTSDHEAAGCGNWTGDTTMQAVSGDTAIHLSISQLTEYSIRTVIR